MKPKTKKFWTWKNQADGDEAEVRVLELYGTIAEESWFDDDITPAMFREELFAGDGDVVIWINSPGGDCIAASQIYSMLMDYKGNVTVKIDGVAASAASVIAMAGTQVLMAPTALMMIHNPMTVAFGDHTDMQKAIEMLDEVKESIINAYEIKTCLSRAKLSHLMDSETWMNANKAVELGFADDILTDEKLAVDVPAYAFSGRAVENALLNKITAKIGPAVKAEPNPAAPEEPETTPGRTVDELMARLNLIKP
ncbi:MAG: Clp protease ClpP [Oscillospiraceae bacterium]|nr:Clp protease ClpP [Oscillospiraceae bacterium]